MEHTYTYSWYERDEHGCVAQRPPSVSVEGSGELARKLAEQAKQITFTGLAQWWTVKITELSNGHFRMLLLWSVPCRDTGKQTTLEYREEFPIHYFEDRYKHVSVWVNDALRYVMRHEADETILLSDGTRPFDPHRKETL
jgi:hypothetical protein